MSASADLMAANRLRVRESLVLVLLIWLAMCLAFAAPLFTGTVLDALSTDDRMRLAEVRDLLAGQGWRDLHQYRLNPEAPVLMHWSRLVDAPLAGLMRLFGLFTETTAAEAITMSVWPMMLLGAALMAVRRMAILLGGEPAAVPALMLAALSLPVLAHFRPGAIDHHNVQLVLVMWMTIAMMQIETWRSAPFVAALTASASLAIGLEMLPAVAAGCVVAGLAWITNGAACARAVAMFGFMLAASSLGLLLALTPFSTLTAPVCDAFGAPSVTLAAMGGLMLCTAALGGQNLTSPWQRLMLGIALGGGGIGLAALLFPSCLKPPYADIQGSMAALWLNNVSEALPVTTVARLMPDKLPAYYALPLMGLAAGVWLCARNGRRMPWIAAVMLLVAHTGVALWQLRGIAGATLAATPIAGALVAGFIRPTASWPALRMAAIAFLISPTFLFIAGTLAIKGQIKSASAIPCNRASDAIPLASLPAGRVLSFIDLGPSVLAHTPHAVFTGPYHRNLAGNALLFDVMQAAPDKALTLLRAHHINYLVTCPLAPEQSIYNQAAPEGLAAQLWLDASIAGLERIEMPTAMRVWRVIPERP
jgi:hypothetical protein